MMTIAVEESFFGKLYRTLDTMPGVASISIHSEGVKTLNGAAKAVQKQGGSKSVYCLVLGTVISKPGATRADLYAAVEATGKRSTSVPDALTKLKKAKHIAIKGKGKGVTYSATPAGKKHYETACSIEEAA
jgi:hypothetical protein